MDLRKEAAEIQQVILSYALAYQALQNWQEKSPVLIPPGDQKTGCIGEFYVYLYLSDQFPDSTLTYGNHSQKGWDIELSNPTAVDFKIQVKTVSAYSKTRTISPIHRGWDQLHVVYLNKMLEPEGFWIVRDIALDGGETSLKGRKCPKPGKAGTGSKGIDFGVNKIEDLRLSIERQVGTIGNHGLSFSAPSS